MWSNLPNHLRRSIVTKFDTSLQVAVAANASVIHIQHNSVTPLSLCFIYQVGVQTTARLHSSAGFYLPAVNYRQLGKCTTQNVRSHSSSVMIKVNDGLRTTVMQFFLGLAAVLFLFTLYYGLYYHYLYY